MGSCLPGEPDFREASRYGMRCALHHSILHRTNAFQEYCDNLVVD